MLFDHKKIHPGPTLVANGAWRQADRTPVPPAPEVREHVRQALRETVARHLVADVPVGVFLSGGIDSGTLAGLMVEAGARDLQGVTITDDEFRGQHQVEAPVAAQIAASVSHPSDWRRDLPTSSVPIRSQSPSLTLAPP